MKSKNSKPLTDAERHHLESVKSVGCAVCDTPGFVYTHHIKQGQHFTCVALCYDCHQGPMGIHGDQTLWRIHKMDELSALNETLRRVYA